MFINLDAQINEFNVFTVMAKHVLVLSIKRTRLLYQELVFLM